MGLSSKRGPNESTIPPPAPDDNQPHKQNRGIGMDLDLGAEKQTVQD